MISGYVSSDDDEIDDFYSDPFEKPIEPLKHSFIKTKEIKDELLGVLDRTKKINLFMKSIVDDYSGDNIDVLEELISLGVSVDSTNDPQGWTPLMKACSLGKSEVVQFLLEQGADPNLQKELFSPVMASCIASHTPEESKLDCLRLLLQYNADVNAADKYRTTPLMCATQSGSSGIVDLLLAVPGIDVNIQDKDGSTALFYAVINNDLELVKKLLEAGINKNLIDRYGRTALNIALLKEFEDVAKILGYSESINLSETKATENENSYDLLSDLPTPNGSGGFSSDVEGIINSLPLVKPKGRISLPHFLTATEDDLCEFGIAFKYDRLKLMKFTIHEYHLSPWRKSSMPSISPGSKNITDGVEIVSNILKHLTIANASLTYLKTRIASRLKCNVEDLTSEKNLISVLLNTYCSAEKMRAILQNVIKYSKQIEICTPDDFIGFKKSDIGILKFISLKWIHTLVVATATAATACIYYHRSHFS